MRRNAGYLLTNPRVQVSGYSLNVKPGAKCSRRTSRSAISELLVTHSLPNRENSEVAEMFCDLEISCSGEERARNYKAPVFSARSGIGNMRVSLNKEIRHYEQPIFLRSAELQAKNRG